MIFYPFHRSEFFMKNQIFPNILSYYTGMVFSYLALPYVIRKAHNPGWDYFESFALGGTLMDMFLRLIEQPYLHMYFLMVLYIGIIVHFIHQPMFLMIDLKRFTSSRMESALSLMRILLTVGVMYVSWMILYGATDHLQMLEYKIGIAIWGVVSVVYLVLAGIVSYTNLLPPSGRNEKYPA